MRNDCTGMNVSAGTSIPDYTKLVSISLGRLRRDLPVEHLTPEKQRQMIQERLVKLGGQN